MRILTKKKNAEQDFLLTIVKETPAGSNEKSSLTKTSDKMMYLLPLVSIPRGFKKKYIKSSIKNVRLTILAKFSICYINMEVGFI